ncbi:MAG: hypothetical protein AB7I27_00930 [Bacteriovoracaceae bacterium]
MNLDQRKLFSLLPNFFVSINQELSFQGYLLTLVGGVVRDYFLNGHLGKDWDIELSHETLAWSEHHWKELGKNLSKYGRVSFLPYEVIRLELHGHQLEFSPPRQEKFNENWKSEGHKNFLATFDYKLSFDQAVKRRDFSINAIGMRVHTNSVEILDPLDGLRHLREKTLHYCGEDFEKDPVRFLRALRFALKFKFSLSLELEHILERMPVLVTPSYLWSEMKKSQNPLGFYLTLLPWQKFHPEMQLPVKEISQTQQEILKKVLFDPFSQECWILALEWVELPFENWQNFFNLSSDNCKRITRWGANSRKFQHIFPEKFHGEFEEIIKQPEFDQLFDWYFSGKQILQKYPELPLMKMIEEYLPHWIHLFRYEPLKDVKHIDPPLRAKYQVWNLCQRL